MESMPTQKKLKMGLNPDLNTHSANLLLGQPISTLNIYQSECNPVFSEERGLKEWKNIIFKCRETHRNQSHRSNNVGLTKIAKQSLKHTQNQFPYIWFCSVNISFVMSSILCILALWQSGIFQHFITIISSIEITYSMKVC